MKRSVFVIMVTLAVMLPAQAMVAARTLGIEPTPRAGAPALPRPARTPAAPSPGVTPVAGAPVPRKVVRSEQPVRAATAKPNPDPLHPTGRLIEVSLERQRLTAWNDGRMIMRLVISTGMPGYDTPTGHFKIRSKSPRAWSKPWKVWMPWAMQWNGNYMIHQLTHGSDPTRVNGEDDLGRPASHGCIRVGVGDAERLYRWAVLGTHVWVH